MQSYIVNPQPGMPLFSEWVSFVKKYQDRILWGSDSVVFTKNKFDELGNPVFGKEMPVADYRAVADILKPLWTEVGQNVARKIRVTNHVRLFDIARAKVRQWEAIHARDNIWNIESKM